jgi:methylmalonyl-CoA/ethylmalonyl-CoA epimerase
MIDVIGEFHHIGYACLSIEKEIVHFSKLGYFQEGEFFSDSIQGVRGCFMNGAGPRIELLENIPDSQTLTPWIDQSIRMYHLAYLVADISQSVLDLQKKSALVLVNPVEAVAFGGRKIAFLMLRNRLLVEIIQKE